jgi:hypothetical protein
MAANDVRNLIDSLIACDEQPSEEQMSGLRTSLEQRITTMKARSRYALLVGGSGVLLCVAGYAMVARAAGGRLNSAWVETLGVGSLIVGAVLVVVGAMGRLLGGGFGYVWARQDLHDAALVELAVQVDRLAKRIDALGGDAPRSTLS